MDFEGSYKIRRKPRYWLLLLLLIPIATVFILLLRKEQQISSTDKLTALDYRNESIQLDDVLSSLFYAKGFNGSFVDDSTIQYFSHSGDLMTLSLITLTSQFIISSLEFVDGIAHHPFRCDFSPSKKLILVSYDPQKIYRHSTYALYSIFDLSTRTFTPLKIQSNSRFQLAKWSEKSDSLVLVQKNDIYILKKIGGNPERITWSGNAVVYNGVTDWVYEEEMFSSNEALYFYDEENLAFVTFNDTLVESISFSVYGNFQYPMTEQIPYPKTGTMNPTAKISIYGKGVTREIQLPSFIPREHLVGQLKWTQDKKLLIQILNRTQNNSWILLCEADSCDVIHTQEQQNGWLDVTPIFENFGNFVAIESTRQEKYSYKNLIEFNSNSVVKVVTRGDFSVEKILATSLQGIFYMSSNNLHRVKKTTSVCLTCHFKCQSNEVVMGTSGEYFVHTCLNGLESVPVVSIYQTEPVKLIKILETNEKLRKATELLQMPITKDFKFSTNGFEVNMKLFLPYDFDEGGSYPLLVDVYGGPSSNRINSRFQVDWGTSLVSSRNVIYALIDGRGSGGQSDEFLFSIYRQFGTVEVEDQIAGVVSLLKTEKYINPNKTAIWGWSYGGFVTAMVMGKDTAGVFKCGISVAPVTNWGFYDTIYTERYMSLPFDNIKNYNASDVTNHLDNFRKKKYMLIHGTADDNVHYQQSMYLSKSLELNDILFFQQSYPDENHGLSSVRPHLYHSLERFLFQECFL